MPVFINSAVQLSPQPTFGTSLPEVPVSLVGFFLQNIEPDYKQFVPPAKLRRMSRVLKMGLATSSLCIQQSAQKPDAVIVGTGQGCSVELNKFMCSYAETDELLSPIPFVNSGHNTLAGQLSQYHQIKGYNTTYLQEGAAFESALTDAMLLLEEGESQCVLVGAFDEYSDLSHRVFSYLGEMRAVPVCNLSLLKAEANGSIMGEGVGFFCLASQPQETSAELLASETRLSGMTDTKEWLSGILAQHNLSFADVDLLFVGRNGDRRTDDDFYAPVEDLCAQASVVGYKHLCGEYPTAHSFALWMAVNALKGNPIPPYATLRQGTSPQSKTVLLYNMTRTAECAVVVRK